jgi:hypothetical protein
MLQPKWLHVKCENFLRKADVLWCRFCLAVRSSVKDLHLLKLFIGDDDDAHLAIVLKARHLGDRGL